jgi:hypothetical protein
MFQTQGVQKIKTHFTFSNSPPPNKILPFGRNWGKICYSHTGHRRQHSTAHEHCPLDYQGYRHTLRICNKYCFSVETLVKRTCLHVVLYLHCYLVVSTCNIFHVLHRLLVRSRFSSYLPVYCVFRC